MALAGEKLRNREPGQRKRVGGEIGLLKHLFDTLSQCGDTV